ncbi:MAG: hypothetical protein Q9199_007770 [Rusavskia elegans]
MENLSAMRKDHDELLPFLQQGHDSCSLKKYKRLVKDINSIEKQVKHAPKTIAEFEMDIEILSRHVDDLKHNSHQESFSTQEGKSVEGQGEVQRRSTF